MTCGQSPASEPSTLKVENGALGNSDGRAAAVTQIPLECQQGALGRDAKRCSMGSPGRSAKFLECAACRVVSQ